MWSWIDVKTVIIVPDDGLYAQRQRAQMALMCYGSNKLQKRKWWISIFPNLQWIMGCQKTDSHAQKDHLFLQLKEASDMIGAFCKAYLDGKIQFLGYNILFWFQYERVSLSPGKIRKRNRATKYSITAFSVLSHISSLKHHWVTIGWNSHQSPDSKKSKIPKY